MGYKDITYDEYLTEQFKKSKAKDLECDNKCVAEEKKITNAEYILQSKEHIIELIEKLTRETHSGCDLCKYLYEECADISCEQGHMAWLDSEYDKEFWEWEE